MTLKTRTKPAQLGARDHVQAGIAAHRANRLDEARAAYQRALDSAPDDFDALHMLGVVSLQSKEAAEGLALITRAIARQPNNAAPYNNLAKALIDLDRKDEALAAFGNALALKPDFLDAHTNRANLLRDLGRHDEALAGYDAAIALKPASADLKSCRAGMLLKMGRFDEALAAAEALGSHTPAGHFYRGNALRTLNRDDEALEAYRQVLTLDPDHADARFNIGNIHWDRREFPDALAFYDQAISLRGDLPTYYNNRGVLLSILGRQADALADYDRAVELDPAFANAHNNRGNILKGMRRTAEASAAFERVLQLAPEYDFAFGSWISTRMKLNDWRGLAYNLDQLRRGLTSRRRVSPPFATLGLTDDPLLQRAVAEIWADRYHNKPDARIVTRPPEHDRIRIGYFSADLHNHATAQLMAELFERHDRARFEIIAFSFGPKSADPMRARLLKAFDQFHEVGDLTEERIAAKSRTLEIDIAVDLKGYTQDSKAGIFLHGAAPVQVAYIGYPGTMGVDFMDYVIADETVIPPANVDDWSEKVVWMPHCYQVNDGHRPISPKRFTRTQFGLPQDGFVFACFNNNYKILPETFDSWCRILAATPNSVLWLFQDNPMAGKALRLEIAARGIDPARLLFAERAQPAEHLARHRLADLFLDSLPYNAHTTASDALWAGLPVLTLQGRSFAGRVASSLLKAVGLPELITTNREAYEAEAIALAGDKLRVQALRDTLDANRRTFPLFDCPRFARDLEIAFTEMHRRCRLGLPADHLRVADYAA
jgi:predicted O-linked N-acetylglucosamine transferase (SPINDLY family)